MAAVTRTWRKNPLRAVFMNPAIKSELEATCRRVFIPWIVWHIYTAPEHCYVDIDEIGQWEDDGGAGARHADSPPRDL